MFDKFIKSYSLEDYYVGYRVRKDTVMSASSVDGEVKSDVVINTYISDMLFIFAKDGDMYRDTKLGKRVSPVHTKELCSLHLDSSTEYLSRDNYTRYSKNDLFGVYGISSLESVINSVTEGDSLNDVPNLKVDKNKGLTLAEAEVIVKAINKYIGAGADSLNGPMIGKDALDEYETDFDTVNDFVLKVEGMNPLQVKEFIKSLNRGKYEGNN